MNGLGGDAASENCLHGSFFVVEKNFCSVPCSLGKVTDKQYGPANAMRRVNSGMPRYVAGPATTCRDGEARP